MLDAIRRSRASRRQTLFEMEETPEVLAVQAEYMRLAATPLGRRAEPADAEAAEAIATSSICWASNDA